LGVFYGVVLMPLRNTQGKALGMVVITKDFSSSRAAQNRSIVWQILMAVFAIVFMSGLIMIVIRGAFLRPLQALTRNFSHLADGDPSPDTPIPDKLCTELEELAHQYDRLRKAKVRLQK
jgi:HAMP domain-containing protein